MKEPLPAPWILNCLRLPVLVGRSQIRDLLGLKDDDKASAVVTAGLLTACGDRADKQKILVRSKEIEEKRDDSRWANKVALVDQGKAQKKRKTNEQESPG